jgi:predicted dehydrogenase
VSDNLEQARELFDLADKKNLTLHIGHVERFNGAVQELFKIVEDPIYLEWTHSPAFQIYRVLYNFK